MNSMARVDRGGEEAEKFYSEGLRLNMGSRQLWTNRAICRNTMKKFEDALSDCDSALSINPKCTKSTIQKGNALLGLNRFDEAREYYESLRPLGENFQADTYLKKLNDAQERDDNFIQLRHSMSFQSDFNIFLQIPSKFPKPATNSGLTSKRNKKKSKAGFESFVFISVSVKLKPFLSESKNKNGRIHGGTLVEIHY